MNKLFTSKNAQSTGFTWFFATIVIFLILILFIFASALLGFSQRSSNPPAVIQNIENIQNLHEFSLFYEYGNNDSKNELSDLIKSSKGDINNEVKDHFLSYAKQIHNLEIGKSKNSCLILFIGEDSLATFMSEEFMKNVQNLDSLSSSEIPSSSLTTLLKITDPVYVYYDSTKQIPVEIISEGC